MCPAQRDTLTGHFFASLCPLRQFANCFAMSATFPSGTQGRRDFIAGLFLNVPTSFAFCLSHHIVTLTRILNHIIRTKGLYCRTFFRRPDVICATLLHLPGQIFALEQCQELFSYRDTCERPVGRDFLMRDTVKRVQLVVKSSC